MGINRKMRRANNSKAVKQMNKAQPNQIDYQLHQAQQLEILNSNIELLKNNVYGQSQVEIVLYFISAGDTEEVAIEKSLALIDKMNEVNSKRAEARRAELQAKMAESPAPTPVPIDVVAEPEKKIKKKSPK